MADGTVDQRENQGKVAARTLKGLALFDGFDEAERRRLETSCRWRLVRAGERVLETDSDSRDVFFVVQDAINIVDLSLSGREIASRTSTTRETVNRALAQLYPLDLLRRKGRNLYVMNRAALDGIIQTLQLQDSARTGG